MVETQSEHTSAKPGKSRYAVAEANLAVMRQKMIEAQVETRRALEDNARLLQENKQVKALLSRAAFGRDDAGLLNRGEVLALQTAVKRYCGIYFLLKDGEVVYVGQSVNVWNRIETHRIDGKDFDAVAIDPCPQSDLNRLEMAYIEKFNPPLNMSKSGYSRRFRLGPPPLIDSP